MSQGVNKVILIGNLGRDAELSYTPSGTAVARLSLATSEGRKKDDGTWEDFTEWHRVVVFGPGAERIGQNKGFAKGQQVYVEGKIHYGSYEKEGQKHNTADVVAFTVRLLGRREESSRSGEASGYSGPPPSMPSGPMPEADVEDDLPF